MASEKSCSCCGSHHSWMKWVILLVALLAAIYLVALSRNAFRSYDYIGKNPENAVSIVSFSGEGKVTAKPDIAIVQMGLSIEKKKVSDAQKESTDTMNSFIDRVKSLGVEPKDIRTTDYSIYPQYDWTNGRQLLRGYQITQNVEVKVRNLEKITDILALAGEFNLNQVGSLRFDIDQKDDFIKQAREDAISKAKKNADDTAKALGISLGKIASFSEGMFQPPQIYNGYMEKAIGMGGGGGGPDVQSGTAEITVNVTLSYEVR